ncbi:hypothetical protein HD806DRAFT_359159 [Xylariaceae sp. AK1471]|nr:hypothetical protein HD806DRAFT_359159 [Xylariaceae sp. AK1471]
MVAAQVIQDWIDSVKHSTTILKRSQSHDPELHEHEPTTKQLRYESETVINTDSDANGDTFSYPHDMPSTPPMTSTNASIPPKRGNNHLDSADDLETTPKPPSLPYLRRPRSRSNSPTKRVKTGLKSRENLSRLEKPVSINGLEGNIANIPPDIKGLYKNVKAAAQYRQHILPHEVRSQVEATEDDIPEYAYREPDRDQATSGEESTVRLSNALAAHVILRSIVRVAGISEQYKRAEAGWNHHVHTPLLDLVFGSDPLDIPEHQAQDAQKPVVARFEAVMGATVVGTAIPLMQQSRLDQPNLACSVSVDSSAKDSDDSAVDLARADLNAVHSRSESKKVDYVLVMYISEKLALRQVIWDSTFEQQLGYGYVNQTRQLNLLYNPIAASIETKITSSREDPLIQLGFWTAAWHKRMYALRERLFPPTPQSYLATTLRTPPKLVSVPLVEVVSHEWFIYFACDSGTSISVYGPLRIGSTRSIIEVYTLVTSLEHVKQWIETSFRKGIEAWFLHE